MYTRRTLGEEGRNWADVFTSQGMPKIASEPPEAREEAWKKE